MKPLCALIGLVVLLACAQAAADDVLEEWVARYDGGNDLPHDLVIDEFGNVYVTGETEAAVRPDDWSYLTIKYDPSGGEEWTALYNGWDGIGLDAALAIAIDDSGNVYVTGESESETDSDYATVKYDPEGRERWARRYNGPAGTWDYGHDVAVNDSFHVFVTGYSRGLSSYDYATVKYDQFGAEKWVARYDGPDGRGDVANAVTVDGDGNVYVTGNSVSLSTGADYATVKYDWSGEEQWAARYTRPVDGGDYAVAIAVDQDGFTYVTGASTSDSGTGFDYATVKYDPEGNEEWVARYNHESDGDDEANAIAVDAAGNVYVTGASKNVSDYATVKYDADGNEEWVRRYSGAGSDEGRAIVLDDAGNVYVTGNVVDGNNDFCTLSYDPDGNLRWAVQYSGIGGGDRGEAIAIGPGGAIVVTGYSGELGVDGDWATVQYAPVASVPAGGDGEGPRLALAARTPCSGSTTLRLGLPFDASRATTAVYTVQGRLVAELTAGPLEAGEHELVWDGRDGNGRRVASGVYFAVATADGEAARTKLVVLR